MPEQHIVHIVHPPGGERKFEPAEITIAVNDSIIWQNDAPHIHTALREVEPFLFDTGDIEPGASSDEKFFPEAGDFDYVCFYHDDMTGVVHVKA